MGLCPNSPCCPRGACLPILGHARRRTSCGLMGSLASSAVGFGLASPGLTCMGVTCAFLSVGCSLFRDASAYSANYPQGRVHRVRAGRPSRILSWTGACKRSSARKWVQAWWESRRRPSLRDLLVWYDCICCLFPCARPFSRPSPHSHGVHLTSSGPPLSDTCTFRCRCRRLGEPAARRSSREFEGKVRRPLLWCRSAFPTPSARCGSCPAPAGGARPGDP